MARTGMSLANSGPPTRGAPFLASTSPRLHDAIVNRLPREVTGFLPFFGTFFCDEAHRKDVETAFQGRVEKRPGGPRNLAESLETISLCTALKDVQQRSVRAFLEKY